VRRNEQLWHTLDIGNMFVPTFGVKNVIVISILGMKLPGKLQSPWILSSYMKEKMN
jgi:hypothetical protein